VPATDRDAASPQFARFAEIGSPPGEALAAQPHNEQIGHKTGMPAFSDDGGERSAVSRASAPRCLVMRSALDHAPHRQVQVVNRPRSLNGGVRPRVQPEKTCHSESTAGLPSRADLLADGRSRDFVPWRFSDAGRPSVWRARHCRRPKTCTKPDLAPLHQQKTLRAGKRTEDQQGQPDGKRQGFG
jgi:hypothetical protein